MAYIYDGLETEKADRYFLVPHHSASEEDTLLCAYILLRTLNGGVDGVKTRLDRRYVLLLRGLTLAGV